MPSLAAGPPPDRFRLVKHLGNGGSGKDVVELLKQQRAPIRTNRRTAFQGEQRSHCVALPQQPLQAAVVTFLVRAAGGTTAMKLEVQLITPDRQLPGHGLQPVEVLPKRTPLPGQRRGFRIPELHLLQHLLRGPATVIADPRDPQQLRDTAALLPLPLLFEDVQWIPTPSDRGKHQAHQLPATSATPAKQPVGEWVGGIPSQLVGAEPTHIIGLRDGGKTSCKPEAVRQPGQVMAPLRKCGAAVGLTDGELLPQRRRAHQHTIRFHPGAVDRFPATGTTGPADR